MFTNNNNVTVKEIKSYAKEHNIHVPSSIRRKADIIAYVDEAIGRMDTADGNSSVEMAPEVAPIEDEEIVSVGDLPQTKDKVILEEEDDSKWIPLMAAIKTAMIKQSLERKYQKLFFKDDDGNYISVASHFYGMVAACIRQLYPKTVGNGRVPQRYLDQTVDEIIKEGLVWTYDHPKYHKVLVSNAKILNRIYKEVYPTK